MDQPVLLSALLVEGSVVISPLIYLNQGTTYGWTIALVMIPSILTAESLLATVFGLTIRRNSGPNLSSWLLGLSILVLAGGLWSLGFYPLVSNWAAMDCNTLEPWKCMVIQSTGYIETYLGLGLIVPIATLVGIIPQIYRPRPDLISKEESSPIAVLAGLNMT